MKLLLKEWKRRLYESADIERLEKLAQLGDEEAQAELDKQKERRNERSTIRRDIHEYVESRSTAHYSAPYFYYTFCINAAPPPGSPTKKKVTVRLPDRGGNKYKIIDVILEMQDMYESYPNQLMLEEAERYFRSRSERNRGVKVQVSPAGFFVENSALNYRYFFDNNSLQVSVTFMRNDSDNLYRLMEQENVRLDYSEFNDRSNPAHQIQMNRAAGTRNAIEHVLRENERRVRYIQRYPETDYWSL